VDTLKTAVIVVLLLAVVYGAYVVLSKPDAPLPQEIAWHDQKSSEPLQIDLGKAEPQSSAAQKENSSAKFASMWSSENKTNEPKPLDQTESHSASPTVTEVPEIPKPSAAGLTIPASPSILGSNALNGERKPAATESSSVAAPNLLGSAASSDSTAGVDSVAKSVANPGLPSLPDLRNSATDTKLPADSTSLIPVSKDSDSFARLDPSSTTDSSAGKTGEPARPSADTNTVPAATPDPALGPILETGNSAQGITTSAVYDAALRESKVQMDEEKWHSALFTLSKFIHSPDLNAEQNSQLYDVLDPLAAKVIYSTEHLVEPAYEVRRGDRLADIAQTYQLPWELLANINGIENPDVLVPGTKLKVLRGPFRAEVNLQTSELTLFAGQLYAGRFPISVGKDPAPKPGEYRILEKQLGRVYYAGDGRTIAADDAANPYGRVWLGLGNELSIHSSPDGGEARGLGCISLSPLDATDIYGILSQGSSVLIRR
jgi:lipoprotein-anchoring transpeptidase ErfK/SrfK